MKPDRSNYELWFTDWLDGNLTVQQVDELKSFLHENPDLEEEFNSLSLSGLVPSGICFDQKKQLHKSVRDLSDPQFEYLCIADLENDLSEGQKAELDEIIAEDQNRKKSHAIYQKLRLRPDPAAFPRKSIVRRLTAGQKIMRFSLIGLSAAATVAMAVALFRLIPSQDKNEVTTMALNSQVDTILIRSYQPVEFSQQGTGVYENIIIPDRSEQTTNTIADLTGDLPAQTSEPGIPDSSNTLIRQEALGRISYLIPSDMLLAEAPWSDLIRTFEPGWLPPLIDNRSNVEIFFARIFREKIMRDTISGTRPVESFEIAQASLNGLNKLFGWKLALNRNTDESGNIRSYNFSSGLVKINAPVRKPSGVL